MLNIIAIVSLYILSASYKIYIPADDSGKQGIVFINRYPNDKNLRGNYRSLAIEGSQQAIDLTHFLDTNSLNDTISRNEYMARRNIYLKAMGDQRNIINNAVKILPAMKFQLANDEVELPNVVNKLALLKNQTANITQELILFKRVRDVQKANFIAKLTDSRGLIIGIEKTLESFHKQATADPEINQIAVQEVAKLMRATKDSLTARMNNDIKIESEAEKNYKAFVQNNNNLLEQNKVDMESLTQRKDKLNAEIIELRNKIRSETFKKGQAEIVLAQAVADLSNLDKKYSSTS